VGNRTKKFQTNNWFRSMKKLPSWEEVRRDKVTKTTEKLNETNQIKELLENINNTPNGIIRILKRC
jgi:hypothetical protein